MLVEKGNIICSPQNVCCLFVCIEGPIGIIKVPQQVQIAFLNRSIVIYETER